ncbi:MAG: hypothetical protein AAFR04_03125 [Pseudomonadota bacterium]
MAKPTLRAPTQHTFILAWIGCFVLAHIAIVAFVTDLDQSFMLGDRAQDRMAKLSSLLHAGDLNQTLRVLFTKGIPGDYAFYAPGYLMAGVYGIFIQALALYAVALFMLYRMSEDLFSATAARITVIVYSLLPATIFHPHAFVSEAICNPLLIIATALSVRLMMPGPAATAEAREMPTGRLMALGLALAGLVMTRYIYLVVPFFVCALLALAGWRQARAGAWQAGLVLAVALAPAGLFALAQQAASSQYGASDSVGGLRSNLFLRAERMAAMAQGASPLPASVVAQRRIAPEAFIGYAADNPGPLARTVVSDAANIIANPGVAMVAGRFLKFFDLRERSYRDLNKWREARDKGGALAVAKLLWETSPVGFIMNAAGLLAWGVLLLVALFGAWRFARDARHTLPVKLLLLGMPVLLLGLTSVLAGYTRWDHRSPTEFIIAMGFALGAMALAELMRRRKSDTSQA